MNLNISRLLLAGMIVLACQSAHALEPYEFPDEQTRLRFQELTYELRCPKCQNQNIADSNAPIAKDLRQEVHRLLEEGKRDDEIVYYLVERYGDFIRYRPPFSLNTALLWLTPIVLVVVGVGVALWLGRRRKVTSNGADDLSPEEEERLARILRAQDRTFE